MHPPTLAQQRGFAFAPIPFATISILSSSLVIYHILFQQPQKRKRLYHRLVLSMNMALIPLSLMYIWGPFSVPEGTPYYVGARGNQATCTANGFLSMVFMQAVPIYYGSLVLQAYLGIKNNFMEEKYRWIEIPVNLFAYIFPCTMAIVVAATDNFNPNGSGCWYAKAPRGCETNPDVPCERGGNIDFFIYLFGFTQAFLYVIFPPSVILAMYCWLKKISRKIAAKRCRGAPVMRETARKEMMHSIYLQLALYLFAFWLTWIFNVIHALSDDIFKGETPQNFFIFANCWFTLQGFIYMLVYFAIQRMGGQTVDFLEQMHAAPLQNIRRRPPTVTSATPPNAQQRKEKLGTIEEEDDNNLQESLRGESMHFNIFDGTAVDEDSPWAKFIYPDDCDDEEDTTPGEENIAQTLVVDSRRDDWTESEHARQLQDNI